MKKLIFLLSLLSTNLFAHSHLNDKVETFVEIEICEEIRKPDFNPELEWQRVEMSIMREKGYFENLKACIEAYKEELHQALTKDKENTNIQRKLASMYKMQLYIHQGSKADYNRCIEEAEEAINILGNLYKKVAHEKTALRDSILMEYSMLYNDNHITYTSLNELEKARTNIQKAIALFELGMPTIKDWKKKQGLSTQYGNMATLLLKERKCEEAIKYAYQARGLQQIALDGIKKDKSNGSITELKYHKFYPLMAAHQGLFYDIGLRAVDCKCQQMAHYKGQWKKAREIVTDSLFYIDSTTHYLKQYPLMLMQYGFIAKYNTISPLILADSLERVEAYLEETKRTLKTAMPSGYANIHTWLALGYLQREDVDKALEFLKKDNSDNTIYFPEQVNQNTINSIAIHNIRGLIHLKTYVDDNSKIDHLKKSLLIYDSLTQFIDKIKLKHPDEVTINAMMNNVQAIYGIATVASHFANKEKLEGDYFEKALSYAEHGKAFNLQLANKRILMTRNFSNKSEKDIVEKDITFIKKLNYWNGIVNAEGNTSSPQIRLIDSLLTVQKEYDTFRKNHIDYFKKEYSLYEPKVKKIQEGLNADQAIVEYISFGDGGIALIMCKEIVMSMTIEQWAGFLELLEDYRASTMVSASDSIASTFYTKSELLYEKLLAPIIKSLPKEVTRLTIIPDGDLGQISFASLIMSNIDDEPAYLVDSFSISYAYSLGVLDVQRKAQSEKVNTKYDIGSFVAIPNQAEQKTNPKAVCSNSDLPAIRKVSQELPTMMLGVNKLYPKTTEKLFLDVAKNHKILHLGMHGCLNPDSDLIPNPLNYTLAFHKGDGTKTDDGRLTCLEIHNLKLNADMVVMASCETGTGKTQRGEGVYSIARAWAFAGVPSTIATLSSVYDESTAKILKYFYQYIKEGNPKDVALQKAHQSYLKNGGRDLEPQKWCNIICIGDISPIE